ncbi:DUF502 domain-containing protein [Sulfitobacter mediterraneus]|uniref:DUF502 domain-containing protein n=1 Tax=Sulfitobacter mediterraneus TaxID=83219 RepID=UPI0019342CB6|nr:DUF502 domain-containing protein [Sulfitobacter mediterraneus]MBM1309525.1 DUF502 domain-containing protein [Sulfitobacter mediterraneus]MBM1313410.1 DUF502 domain-containing protein [Sulfitobacter mediterraneus]MBM1321794.1 DUF502 domain-containing protein [Sulfitobacter mediterraneus]MBM1325681.1 DUF502 domain-containing protein [Sulfitobacter mediterraneus]MBM1397027.1 DUF502 domain-containing protein [Sulfitobacter mediterraneus]
MNTPFDIEPTPKRGVLARLRASFLTGLVVIAPVGLTIWLIWTVVGWIDGFVLPLVPEVYHPDRMLQDYLGLDPSVQINVRGLGVVIFLLFTIIVGWMAKGIMGRSLIRFAEGLVERTPVVRSIYSGIKQISETIFAQSERSFETACLIEYPRRGIWALGFISTTAKGEVAAKTDPSDEMISIFLPTTPNPTSGFLLFFPRKDVIELDMTVEDAAKLVISAGLVYPSDRENGEGVKGGLTDLLDKIPAKD